MFTRHESLLDERRSLVSAVRCCAAEWRPRWASQASSPWRIAGSREGMSPKVLPWLWEGHLESPAHPLMPVSHSAPQEWTECEARIQNLATWHGFPGLPFLRWGSRVGAPRLPDFPLGSFLPKCSECQLHLPLFNHSTDSSVKSGVIRLKIYHPEARFNYLK